MQILDKFCFCLVLCNDGMCMVAKRPWYGYIPDTFLMIKIFFQDCFIVLDNIDFILFRIATQSSSQNWTNEIRQDEWRTLNTSEVADLGDIAACIGIRPDQVTEILELLGNHIVSP